MTAALVISVAFNIILLMLLLKQTSKKPTKLGDIIAHGDSSFVVELENEEAIKAICDSKYAIFEVKHADYSQK